MVQGSSGHRGTALVRNQRDSFPTLQKEKIPDQERVRQQIIFDEAIEIACDWLDAAGRPITEIEYDNLFRAGFASFQSHEVGSLFYDWEDYLKVGESYYERPEDKAKKEWELVEVLYEEAQAGLIPIELFLQTEAYSVENPVTKRQLRRFKLTSDYAATDKVLESYHKYVLINHLLQSRPSDQEATEERKISLSLGFTISTSKPLSSFVGSIKTSHVDITDTEIHQAAEDLGIFDYVFPDSRKEHLKRLLEAGQPPPEPEYFYDLEAKKLVVLGRTALSQFLEIEGRNYLKWLSEQEKLSIGRRAADSFRKYGSYNDRLQPLSSLLTAENFPLEGNWENKNRFRDWPKELVLEYGKWLMQIANLDADLLKRAHRLGLGPGVDTFSSPKRFGSVTNFFSELGFTNRIPKGHMDTLNTDELIEHVRKVAELNDGRVTIALLREYYQAQEIKEAPSVWVLQKLSKGQLSGLLEQAGFKIHNKKYGAQGCLDMVNQFISSEGRFPTARDFDKNPSLPSRPTIARYFGGLTGLKSVLLEEQNPEELLAA